MIAQDVLQNFASRNVLVTGGTGLIGRVIVRMLGDASANVKIVSLDKIKVDPRAEHVFGDLTDLNFCKEITQDMDYVFHVAGIKGSIDVTKSHPASFFVPLLMMNTNMLEACRINKVQKVVYTSSIGAYSSAEIFKEDHDNNDAPPMDMYPGWAKRMAEMQVQAYKTQYGLTNFSVVRPCNVYGPGDNFDPENAMVIPTLMYRIHNKENPVVVWGDGTAIRDFAYSEDVAEGTILALYHGTQAAPFVNLGSGMGYTIKALVETLHEFIPFNYAFDTSKPSGFPRRIMDVSLAKSLIQYNPTTTLREGLEKTWNWFTENQKEYLLRQNYFTDDE